MEQADDQAREIAELRDRLSRLSQASLRINESLDFDTVLQGVLDSACSLTGARYGVITLLDESGQIQDFVTSGLTAEDRQRFAELPEGMIFFEYLSRITEPLRLRDFHSHTRALGLPEFRPPMAVSPVLTFLAAPIRHLGESVGAFYVGEKDDAPTLLQPRLQFVFWSSPQRTKRPWSCSPPRRRWSSPTPAGTGRSGPGQDRPGDILVNTTPVGQLLVFDAKTGGVTLPAVKSGRGKEDRQRPCARPAYGSAEQLLEVSDLPSSGPTGGRSP